MKKAFEVINPGVRQCDAVSEIQAALIKGTPEFGGDYAVYCSNASNWKRHISITFNMDTR